MEQPAEVSIETLALCNAACNFCPYPTLERKGVSMPDAMIFDLIEQMAGFKTPFSVSPFKVNEPLLDKRLAGICRRIIQFVPAASLRIFTNGTPLTVDQIDWIAELPGDRVQHLWVSLNSLDADEYENVMQLPLRIVEKRLDALHAAVSSGHFKHEVVISRVASGRVVTQWQSTDPKDFAFIKEVTRRWPAFFPTLIKRDGWLGYVEPGDKRIPPRPCARWYELNITATGNAALCCMDGKGEYSVGSVATHKLLEIYNQPHLRKRREFSITRAGIEPCAKCTY